VNRAPGTTNPASRPSERRHRPGRRRAGGAVAVSVPAIPRRGCRPAPLCAPSAPPPFEQRRISAGRSDLGTPLRSRVRRFESFWGHLRTSLGTASASPGAGHGPRRVASAPVQPGLGQERGEAVPASPEAEHACTLVLTDCKSRLGIQFVTFVRYATVPEACFKSLPVHDLVRCSLTRRADGSACCGGRGYRGVGGASRLPRRGRRGPERPAASRRSAAVAMS
jgi:hypothetical protein